MVTITIVLKFLKFDTKLKIQKEPFPFSPLFFNFLLLLILQKHLCDYHVICIDLSGVESRAMICMGLIFDVLLLCEYVYCCVCILFYLWECKLICHLDCKRKAKKKVNSKRRKEKSFLKKRLKVNFEPCTLSCDVFVGLCYC